MGRAADGLVQYQCLRGVVRQAVQAGRAWSLAPAELRHSGASLMLAQGTPLHVVSEILGHASITITKDVDGHLVEGDRGASLRHE